MRPTSERSVTITGNGRSGQVIYQEPSGSMAFHWDYGGADVVAIVQAGDANSWQAHPWARERRAEILRFVAAEVVRQKAPSCVAEIDDRTGDILLRQGKPITPRAASDTAW